MFSFVIVNWNGENLIKQCLDSFTRSKFKEFKLYIVDNGSKDNSKLIINEFKELLDIELIELDMNYGFAKANNIGINEAMKDNAKYIITLNNDIEIQEDTLSNLVEYIEHNKEVDVFQLLMINYYDRSILDSVGMDFNKLLFVTQLGFKDSVKSLDKYGEDIKGACAGAAVYSKKALLDVRENENEYFDNSFFAYYEDVDLALRLNSRGYKTRLVKSAIVYHMHSATGNKNSTFKDYYLTRNLFKYLEKNLDEKTYRNNKKYYYKNTIGRIIRYLKVGNMAGAKAILKGYFDYKNKV